MPKETEAFIGIGSNLAPERNIRKGLSALRERLRVTDASRFYWNPAVHLADDGQECPDFVNGVVRVITSRDPCEIKFAVLREIESLCGRVRTNERYAPRTLDLDLLAYGDLQVSTPGLVLPDPDIVLRPFWAVPLCELAPERVFPGAGRSMKEIVRRIHTGSLKEDPGLTQAARRHLGLANGPV